MPSKIVLAILLFGLATPALAGSDWGKECASYGLAAGTAEYKDCVAKMTAADKAAGGTMMQDVHGGGVAGQRAQMQADAARQRAQMQADMARQRAQMAAEMKKKAASGNCVTTHNGTNTSTVCP
ncbi:MAG TPA: hypothetical protein VH000_04675 [Rhizomicrobium sp.]|nr:hypothetical protein [Rhizomicrobium sp.]